MIDADFGRLSALLDSMSELKQRPPLSSRAKELFASALVDYPIEAIEIAAMAHLRDASAGAFTTSLQPAHLIAQIHAVATLDGRPSADEAWSTALASFDELQTVVWTTETAEAVAVARPLLAHRDVTGARLAFRHAYDRLVAAARARNESVRWLPSLGADRDLQRTVLADAVRTGKMSGAVALPLLGLPAMSESDARPTVDAMLGLPAPAGPQRLPAPEPDDGPGEASTAQLQQLRDLTQSMLNRWQRERRRSRRSIR